MSLVNLAHVCSHLQNASKARLGLTSIPVSKMHVNLVLGLQREGFISSVTLGGVSPPKPFLLQSQPNPEEMEHLAQKLKDEPWQAFNVAEDSQTIKALGREQIDSISVPQNPARRRLWLGLKYWNNEPVLKNMKLVSKPTRRIWLTSNDLSKITRTRDASYVKGLTHPGECMFLTTDRGILEARDATTASERLGLTWLGGNATLPKVLVLFTGGTISGGSIYGALDDTQYGQLSITGEDIIARNPYLLNHTQLAVSNWTTENNGSTGTNDALVMDMARFAHDALCSEDSDIVGAVYTHGTNSLEETAFLLDSLVNCGKPIVAVGSMRPWTHLSFDGDANFFDGVMLAASPEARNRGLMVAFNARIIPGYWVTKLYSTNPDAFGATATGDLGIFINSLPVFYNTPSQPLSKYYFDLALISSHSSYPALPQVDILYAAREFSGALVLAAQANGAAGVVIAGTGNGGIPSGQKEIAEAMDSGLQVVVGTRSPFGPSSPSRTPTYAKSGFVHVIQARIMLQLAIASGMGMNETIEVFEGGFRRAIGQVVLLGG
ncbi:hypothetical protein E8E13_009975 [Curvularia kusanoi]|uniref:asparaginase n=1 Tax=Curvularia kusanoi TaxID=90978 RepID=A0A9P4TGH2_CURKU|nr:hypothetical protein E8E13_009975 [Curvularia kusanoi]